MFVSQQYCNYLKGHFMVQCYYVYVSNIKNLGLKIDFTRLYTILYILVFCRVEYEITVH